MLANASLSAKRILREICSGVLRLTICCFNCLIPPIVLAIVHQPRSWLLLLGCGKRKIFYEMVVYAL